MGDVRNQFLRKAADGPGLRGVSRWFGGVAGLLAGLLAHYLASPAVRVSAPVPGARSEEHTSELQSLMRISYAVFCLKKKNNNKQPSHIIQNSTTRLQVSSTTHIDYTTQQN